jgi:hypothetical protein
MPHLIVSSSFPVRIYLRNSDMNVGDTHNPPLEELRATHEEENKYGVQEIPK